MLQSVDVSHKGILRAYKRYAPVYDRIFGALLEPGRRQLAQLVTRIAPRNILEVGVGTGLMLAHYPRNIPFTGIDLSVEMLARARVRALRMTNARISLLQMDAERMGFPDASFDCITLPYVLSVTPDPDRLVAEVCRVCRPGGTIALLNHFSGGSWLRWAERAIRPFSDRLGFRSEFDFERHVGRQPWTVETVTPSNILGLSRLVVIRNAG
jgi:phosphatidylethanolamine/phosphatidyl-N-methylethanolamine N-methyltransferase